LDMTTQCYLLTPTLVLSAVPRNHSRAARVNGPASTATDGTCGSVSAASRGETALSLLEGVPQRGTNRRILPPARYPVRACCTAESTFVSCGNLTQPFFATIRSPTQTVNSPRSPSTNSGCIPNSCLINSATRAALGWYDAQTLQNRMRIGFID
jgi:hypothetical protein